MGSITHQNGPSQQSYSLELITQPFFISQKYQPARAEICTQFEPQHRTNLSKKTRLSFKEPTLFWLPSEFWHSDTSVGDTLIWSCVRCTSHCPSHHMFCTGGMTRKRKWILWKVSTLAKSYSHQVTEPGFHPPDNTRQEARRRHTPKNLGQTGQTTQHGEAPSSV